jgi:hypothetical protein
VAKFVEETRVKQDSEKKTTNSKPLPHIPLPFKGMIADVLKVKPPVKSTKARPRRESV